VRTLYASHRATQRRTPHRNIGRCGALHESGNEQDNRQGGEILN